MRTAITIATVGGKTVLVSGQETPADKQRSAFNSLTLRGASKIELWISGANPKVRRFDADPQPSVASKQPVKVDK